MISNLNSTADKSITIVTAFFDIGRGNWSAEKGHPAFLQRKNETYLSYFKNLAKLDNEMVVFTSEDLAPLIKQIRGEKTTYIVTMNLETKFANCLSAIRKILDDEVFKNKIADKHKQNPEYWSEKYVLINNLKTYFVNKSIQSFNLKNDLIAWVDFGYCRDKSTLKNISNWYYPFDNHQLHFFTLRRPKIFSLFKNPRFPYKKHQVINAILTNKAYIIGGVLVGNKQVWSGFFELIKTTQRQIMNQSLIDDDQGIYLMCNHIQPSLCKLHYLGKTKEGKYNWFGVMQKFHCFT